MKEKPPRLPDIESQQPPRNERVTVHSPGFAVPGFIIDRGLGTVRVSYHAPGEARPRSEWFYDRDGHRRGGERMGDHDTPPVRYS